jgi:uncharacterized protein YuzE
MEEMVYMDYIDNQVTYDKEAEMGYIYLSERFKDRVTYTEELPDNDDIMLDFGRVVPIIGIELEGETARKMERIAGKSNIFTKELTRDGKVYYSFRLSNETIKKSISHPNAEKILFHFSDANCEDFIGIDIFDTKSYSEEYLTGK